jgi:hypothetical protein
VDVFEQRESIDYATGEVLIKRAWVGEITAEADTVLAALPDHGAPNGHRRTVWAGSLDKLLSELAAAAGGPVKWHRGGNPKRELSEVPEAWTAAEQDRFRHEEYLRGFDAMMAKFLGSPS